MGSKVLYPSFTEGWFNTDSTVTSGNVSSAIPLFIKIKLNPNSLAPTNGFVYDFVACFSN